MVWRGVATPHVLTIKKGVAMDDLTLAKLALSLIGHGDSIESLDERSPASAESRRWLPMAKSLSFEAANWPFARQYKALALVTSDPNIRWSYAYRYPKSAVTVWRIPINAKAHDSAPFSIGHDDGGRLVYTNQPDAVAEYTAAVEQPLFYPATFASLVMNQLAVFLSIALTKKPQVVRDMKLAHLEALSVATAHGGNEGRRDEPEEIDLIAAHY